MKKNKKIILEFKIGKFDKKNKYYQNGGGLILRGETSGIKSCPEFEFLFAPCFNNGKPKKMGKSEFKDDQGNEVGLTLDMANSGIGVIDLDGAFDTVYTKYLDEHLTEKEIQAIFDSHANYYLPDLLNFFTKSELEFMGWVFEEEQQEVESLN